MKSLLIAISMACAATTLALSPRDADAARLGGGKAAGMQRQAPAKQADNAPPAQPANAAPANPTNTAPAAAAAPAATGAAAAAGKRSWMGPIAGIAAGLGIAALLSHFGLGEGFANMMTLVLLAIVAFVVIRWLLRPFVGRTVRTAPGAMALAGAGAPATTLQPLQRTALAETPARSEPTFHNAPEGFDAQAFERIAKMIFVRLQAANDAGHVDDLRKFTTPELFASLRVDLQERGAATQKTDVVQLDAEVVDTAQEHGQWIVSVRFHGLMREHADGGAEPFDELWHLVKPADGSRDWAIAGITPKA